MAKPKVLIVDDNALVRRMIAHLLSEMAFTVVEANSAEAARAPLANDNFDVLLCDDDLGAGLSGSSFIAGEATLMPPTVVLMSGKPRPNGLLDSTHYLGKPFTLAQLSAVLPNIKEASIVLDLRTKSGNDTNQRYRSAVSDKRG